MFILTLPGITERKERSRKVAGRVGGDNNWFMLGTKRKKVKLTLKNSKEVVHFVSSREGEFEI